eukprot:TRINITY_DN43979_c0_g2_i1.p1 TRINITY_DN43979_c0_g2~~TRINITY_DN43979_c0_g2_i1.p1  ORF type:complete len:731 (+),score=122.61 TRINITY_DN43979_c0_g2_i1:141-2333(+)
MCIRDSPNPEHPAEAAAEAEADNQEQNRLLGWPQWDVTTSVLVSNLNSCCTDPELVRAAFSEPILDETTMTEKVLSLTKTHVNYTSLGQCNGTAMVEFGSPQEMELAVKWFNHLQPEQLTVALSKIVSPQHMLRLATVGKFCSGRAPTKDSPFGHVTRVDLSKRMPWVSDFTKDWRLSSVQALRSVGPWSNECKREASIQAAYLRAISEAKHLIYIENQFFVSSCTDSEDNEVSNRITKAILERIKLAIDTRRDFKVVIINPLWPGMEGDIANDEAYAIRLVLHLQQKTINRGAESLIQQVKQHLGKDREHEFRNYINFFCLRNYDFRPPKTDGKPESENPDPAEYMYPLAVTEQAYVHAKLMIVDDWTVIIGSANINDRSLHGERDSEVCLLSEPAKRPDEAGHRAMLNSKSKRDAVIMTPDNVITSTINCEEELVSTFAHTLRVHLWAQHLGRLDRPEALLSRLQAEQDLIKEFLDSPHQETTLQKIDAVPGWELTDQPELKSLKGSAKMEAAETYLDALSKEMEKLMNSDGSLIKDFVVSPSNRDCLSDPLVAYLDFERIARKNSWLYAKVFPASPMPEPEDEFWKQRAICKGSCHLTENNKPSPCPSCDPQAAAAEGEEPEKDRNKFCCENSCQLPQNQKPSPWECPYCHTMPKVKTLEALNRNIRHRANLPKGKAAVDMFMFMQKKLLTQVEGTITQTDLDFLIDQDMDPPALSKEGLVPLKVFT